MALIIEQSENKRTIMEKIARCILIVHYNITGFFFYLKYLSHPKYEGYLFYSQSTGKYFRLKNARTFFINYMGRYLNFEVLHLNLIEDTFTFRQLGIYKFKLVDN